MLLPGVQLVLIKYLSGTTVTTCQEPGSGIDGYRANIDNWLKQGAKKNGVKKMENYSKCKHGHNSTM